MYDDWLERLDVRRGDEGADDGKEAETRVSRLALVYLIWLSVEGVEYVVGLCSRKDV